MTSFFHLYLGLLGLVSFIFSPVLSQYGPVIQPSPTCGTVTTTITISLAGEKPSPLIPIPIDPTSRPVTPTLPAPIATPTPAPIFTGVYYQIIAGQPFLLRASDLIFIVGGDPRIDSIPQVNWIYLDRERLALAGQVPADYPAGRITVLLVGQFVSNLVLSLTLEVVRPGSSSSGAESSSTFLPIESGIPLLPSSVPTTSSTAPDTATSGTPTSGTPSSGTPTSGTPTSGTPTSSTPTSDTPTSGTPTSGTPTSGTPTSGTPTSGTPTTLSETLRPAFFTLPTLSTGPTTLVPSSLVSSTTTTALTTSTAIPTLPLNPTFGPGDSFGIPLAPYLKDAGDIVISFLTNPRSDWIQFNVPPPLRPSSLVGTVPETQVPGAITVTLSIYSASRSTGYIYTVPFIIFIREATTINPDK